MRIAIYCLARTRRLLAEFASRESGSISLAFAFSIMAVLLAVGGGLDLLRAHQARQQLSQVAALTCQYATRPSVIQYASSSYSGANGAARYTSAVTTYMNSALTSQQFAWTQTNGNSFSFTTNGPADVSLTAIVPTAMMSLANVTQIPVAAKAHCYDSPTVITQTQPNGASPYIIQEGFEAGNCSTCYYTIPGHSQATSTTSFSATSPTYTGANGSPWYGTGYCLEIDVVGLVNSTTPEGTHAAELDCENGSNSAGNSAISTKNYLAVGNYELRYSYRSRVSYPTYNPVYLCASAASDLSWANDLSSAGPYPNALRTNQMNVYLDASVGGGAPPQHTTIDGMQQLAGGNLIDMCVYSPAWVERSVRIYVSSPGFYWLTFAADGQNDSFGAQLDNVRLCSATCPGSVQDNFPTAWLPSGGVSTDLFRDTFESPSYSAYGCGSTACATNGNLNLSTGTSGTSSSGWPALTAAGWATAPYNQVDYILSGSQQGTQSIELDGSVSGSMTTSNRLISRPFLLVPGYYSVSYWYKPMVSLNGATSTYCGATPAAAGLNIAAPAGYDTNIVASFLSHSQLVSTPVGGGALYSATSFTNPNGTVSTSPTVPPNALSLSSYDSTQPNSLLDVCAYSIGWVHRIANVMITKPANYWLTLSALGQADNNGGAIDDVKVTALGSLAMAVPPSGAIAIKVPNPQASTRVNYSGFYIVANPPRFPVPLQ